MNALVILAHPNPASFNHAIAAAACDALRALGADVVLHDLYAEAFDPVMTAAELARDATLPSAIERHARQLEAADVLVIVHPNWWSQPPAILRGWNDRVVRAGRAYTFVPDGEGGAKPKGLLKARVGLAFTTANTPQAVEESRYGDPLETLWCKVVFGTCGIATAVRLNFAPVIVSTDAQRRAWLEDVRQTVQRYWPGSPPAVP